MKKTMLKILWSFLIGLLPSLLLATAMAKVLMQTETTILTWSQAFLAIFSIKHIKLTCLMILTTMIAVYVLIFDRFDYSTKEIEIAHNIFIPAPYGQGQHGKAWFMKKEEKEKEYPLQILKQDTVKDILDQVNKGEIDDEIY